MRDDWRATLWLFSLSTLTTLCVSAASAANSAVEQRIEHVVGAIPPAVVVEGEPVDKITLSQRMAALHVPGVSVAVIHNGKLDWARGFGVTRIGGDPVTKTTLFLAGSISKPVTALGVLRLVQSGGLDLDPDVNEYLKGWKVPENEFTAQSKVTLRELLSHTAGVTVPGFGGFGGYGGYGVGQPLPTLVQTLDGVPPANNPPIRVDTVPGSQWRYAGGGYVILRQILQDVSGQPFEEFMHRTVLGPLGMEHSTFAQPPPAGRLAQAAMPANNSGGAFKYGPRIYPEMAPDGLWTTASDLARYAIEVQRSLAGRPGAVLSAPMARLMLTPRLNHWGLGPIVGDDEQHPYFTHNGGNAGFVCLLVAYNRRDGAVVMTNSDHGLELAIELVRSISHEYHWPDFNPVKRRVATVDPRNFDDYVGAYQSAPGRYVVVSREGSQLFIQAMEQARAALYPMDGRRFFLKDASAHSFFPRDDEMEVVFKTDPSGKAEALDLYQNGLTPVGSAKRITDSEARPVVERMAALEERIRSQRPSAGEDAVLRRLLGELAAGEPDYDLMTPQVADQVRSTAVLDQQVFSALGPMVSLSFKQVNAIGIDEYFVVFENGEGDMDFSIDADGKIQYALYHQQ